jgi:hypothetical protein
MDDGEKITTWCLDDGEKITTWCLSLLRVVWVLVLTFDPSQPRYSIRLRAPPHKNPGGLVGVHLVVVALTWTSVPWKHRALWLRLIMVDRTRVCCRGKGTVIFTCSSANAWRSERGLYLFISFSFCCVASFTSTRLIDYTMNLINNASKLEGRIARACEWMLCKDLDLFWKLKQLNYQWWCGAACLSREHGGRPEQIRGFWLL